MEKFGVIQLEWTVSNFDFNPLNEESNPIQPVPLKFSSQVHGQLANCPCGAEQPKDKPRMNQCCIRTSKGNLYCFAIMD